MGHSVFSICLILLGLSVVGCRRRAVRTDISNEARDDYVYYGCFKWRQLVSYTYVTPYDRNRGLNTPYRLINYNEGLGMDYIGIVYGYPEDWDRIDILTLAILSEEGKVPYCRPCPEDNPDGTQMCGAASVDALAPEAPHPTNSWKHEYFYFAMYIKKSTDCPEHCTLCTRSTSYRDTLCLECEDGFYVDEYVTGCKRDVNVRFVTCAGEDDINPEAVAFRMRGTYRYALDCAAECDRRNYRYASARGRKVQRCYCGNSYDEASRGTANCRLCQNDWNKRQLCGWHNSYAVYQLGNVCTDNTCEYECDIAAGGCICPFGYTVDGDSCLGLPDTVDTEVKASINGDPHVIIVDDAGVAFCFDVTTATETTAVLIQDQDIGLLVTGQLGLCGGNGTCIVSIDVRFDHKHIRVDTTDTVISVSGMTLPSDEVIYTQGDIVIKTVEDRVHYKHIYLGMDIKLALVYNRFALGLLVLDDSGFSSDVTGIVGQFLKRTFILNNTDLHKTLDVPNYGTVNVTDASHLNAASQSTLQCNQYKGREIHMFSQTYLD